MISSVLILTTTIPTDRLLLSVRTNLKPKRNSERQIRPLLINVNEA